MRRAAAVFLVIVLGACATANAEVCEDVGACTHGGATEWIDQCKASAGALATEAKNSGCGDLYDRYYDCARDRYTCSGDVASFPGCDRAGLDDCLTKARNGAACADLTSRCGDGGLGACRATTDCKTRCYLEVVKNTCAPTPVELDGVAVCSASCR